MRPEQRERLAASYRTWDDAASPERGGARLAMNKMPKAKGSFAKGGMRFTKLRDKVAAALPSDETLRWWFIGNDLGTKNMRPVLMAFSKETVFAVTDRAVHVIPMSGIGVYSSKIQTENIQTTPLGEVAAAFDPDAQAITVGDLVTHIYPNHEFEAVQFAHACGAQMPEWFQPG